MFKNLKAEMIRQDVTVEQIAAVWNVKIDTAREKINGKIGVSLKQCKTAAELFRENNSIDYLFKRT